MITAAEARRRYRRMLAVVGETVTVRRYTGTGSPRPHTDVAGVQAKLRGYAPAELVGGIKQGDTEIILLAEDVAALVPLRKDDKIVIGTKEFNIEAVDDKTCRVGGTTVAVVVQVRG